MTYTLYTAPNCMRCTVVKNFMKERSIHYNAFDFKEDKDIFNAFYRANRPNIYRNPEGVEFPLLSVVENDSVKLVKQGSGEIIAYLLSEHKLEPCVTRSDLLHGWLSGLYVSLCPKEQDENFVTLVKHLSEGGLKIYLQTDGRRPDLLKKILDSTKVSRLVMNIYGSEDVYAKMGGEPLTKEKLEQTITLLKGHTDSTIRLYLAPVKSDDNMAYITPEEAGKAAKMLFDASGDIKLPVVIYISDETAEGVEKMEASALFPYRSKMRNSLVVVDMAKPEEF